MGFGRHIDNLIGKLKVGLGALKKILKIANFATRKNIMDGLINSHITYMLTLWGGAPAYKMDAIQKLQTEALRIVTKRKWEENNIRLISTRELLKQTGKLSVRQMAFYHTVMQVKKVLTNEQPEYLYRKLTENVTTHKYDLRGRAEKRSLQKIGKAGNLTTKAFINRSIEDYNRLPINLREMPLGGFKKSVRLWTMNNVSI